MEIDQFISARLLSGEEKAPKVDLFMSLSDAKENNAGRHDYAFFSVLTCKSCGQHFFEKHYKELEFTKGPRNQLRGFEHGNATQDDSGKDNAVWSTAPADSGTRLVLADRLLEEADGGQTAKSLRWPRAFFCRQCGAMHRESGNRCLADGCGHKEPLLPLIAFGPRLSACPSCSTPGYSRWIHSDRGAVS